MNSVVLRLPAASVLTTDCLRVAEDVGDGRCRGPSAAVSRGEPMLAGRFATGEPSTWISRPSLATWALRPLPNTGDAADLLDEAEVVGALDVDVVVAQDQAVDLGRGVRPNTSGWALT